jgi:hypothetical protein
MHDLPIEIGTPRGLFRVAMNSTPLYSSNICSQTSVSHLCLNNNELMSKAPPLCKGRQPIRCTASRQPQHCTMQVALHTTLHIHVTDAARRRRYTASLKSQGLGVLHTSVDPQLHPPPFRWPIPNPNSFLHFHWIGYSLANTGVSNWLTFGRYRVRT